MKAFAPNGTPIHGTVEFSVSYAHTLEDGFDRDKDGQLTFEHSGETESFYHDGQTTVTRDGETLFEDDNFDSWKGSRLILVEDHEDLAEDDPRIEPDAVPDCTYICDAKPLLDALRLVVTASRLDEGSTPAHLKRAVASARAVLKKYQEDCN